MNKKMNATVFFNATKLAQKSAAIGFITIIGLGLISSIAVALSTLLALLAPLLIAVTKAAIYGYPLFLAGLIAFKIQEQCQKKETTPITVLPLCKPCEKRIKQIGILQNEVLITPPSTDTIFNYFLTPKQPTSQQQILKKIQLELPIENPPKPKIKDASKPTEVLVIPGLDTTSRRDAKALNNQLSILIICWQAISETATLLDNIKASEMKSIASELQISGYRKMNKTQLLIEIIAAHESAPKFS
jgi:hypothetical protein